MSESTERLAVLRQLADALGREIEALQHVCDRETMALFGVANGTIIVSGGKKYRVFSLDPTCRIAGRKPWLWAFPELKNGQFSEHKKRIYSDWEVLRAK